MLEPPPVQLLPESLLPKPDGQASVQQQQLQRGAQFIEQVCRKLRFPIRTTATAQAFYHRYCAHEHGDTVDGDGEEEEEDGTPTDIALTAILVAAKAEETYRRIRDILTAAFLLDHPEWPEGQPVEISEEARRGVVRYEEAMLQAINYQFARVSPYNVLVGMARGELGNRDARVLRHAWSTMQSLHLTPAILVYPVAYLALACIIGARMHYRKDCGREWDYVDRLGLSVALLEHIMHHLCPKQ